MKDETIIVRVPSEMKKNLQKLAKHNRRELSDYIRILFEDVIKFTPPQEGEQTS